MDKQHYRKIIGLIFSFWILLLIGSIVNQQQQQGKKFLPSTPLAFAGNNDQFAYRILSTYITCDTSISDTKKALEKPNQSKVFFHDSTWWMLALRESTNSWHLWRYDSVRTWTPVLEIGASTKSRPDAHVDAATNTAFVFFSNKTAPSTIYKLSYDPVSGTWSEVSNNSVPSVHSVGDDPASFVIAKNGDFWAFTAADTQLIGVHSSDQGVTWSSAVVILDTLNAPSGLTDAVAFTDSGGLNSIALAVGENTTTNSEFHFLIHRDGAADTSWIDESSNLLPLGLEKADDHVALAVDKNNNVYMVTKTNGGGINTPENTLYVLGKGVTVCDTSITDSKKGLEKPNQNKVFFHDGKWWILGKKSSTNKWNLWRYDGNFTWTSVYEFTESSKSHPDVYIDNGLGVIYVFFSGSTSSSIWKFQYDAGTQSWTKLSENAVAAVSTVSDDPASFTVAKNGDIWAFMAADTQLIAVKSSDDGVTWSAAITILDTLFASYGLTDAVAFTDNNGVDYVALGLAENASTNSKFGFFIHKDGDPDTAWVDESSNLAVIGTERSDDHISMAVDRNNNIYVVTKTTGGGVGSPENSLYKRSADSTWQSFILIDGTDWTRPAVVIDDEHDSLYVFGTRESAALGKILEYKRVKIGEESTLETATRYSAIENGLQQFLNVSLPAKAVYDSTELMVIADNEDQSNVWFTRLSIGTPVACPTVDRWRNYVVIEGTGWTRPAVVVDDEHDSLYVFGSRETASLGKVVEYKRCKIGEENTLSDDLLRTTIIDNGTEDFLNISVPAYAVYDSTELMVLVDNVDQNNVWFTRLPIGTAPPCPSYIDTTIYNFTISKSGSDVVLDWTAVAEADSYVVYRGLTPMFSADTARYAVVTTNTFTDTSALGDPDVNHFYRVRAYVAGGPGPLSQRVGEFEYRLLAPTGLKNNLVGLSLNDPGITMASDFVTRIGPTVDLVSKWVDSVQVWVSYIPGLAFTDFSVNVNDIYMISVTAEDTLCLVGDVPIGHQYSLKTNSTGKNNNGMLLLMDTDTLTTASELATSVGTADLVSKWDASVQVFISYIPGLSFTDFPIHAGQPFLVSVTADTTWPAR